MEIIQNKALLLNLRYPERVSAVIPKSKVLGNGNVIVHWGLDEAQVLKNLQIKNIPSPILGRYKWPGMYKPFEHQKETAAFLTMNRRAFCLSEQGTGKTGGVVWAADYLIEIGAIKRVLIICPLSIMQAAWQADLFKIAMHRSVDVAYGSVTKRAAIINSNTEFVIINYDGVEIVEQDILKAKFDLIVVDEANAYATATTKRWKCLNRIIRPDTWLWMLTGTPAAQSPIGAYGLAKLVNPKGVPKYFTSFKDMVMHKINQFKWVAKPQAAHIVHTVLQPAIRHTKKECSDLPDMTYVTRDIELTPQQKKFYDLLRKKLIVQAAGEEVTSVNAAVGLNKLLQISCGAVYTDSGEVLMFDIKNRYKVLKEVIDETKHKVLIFVPFKHAIDLLREALTKDKHAVEVIRGDVPVNKRTDIFRRFQETDDPRILLIQPQAAAHGVTLTAADTVVWWGPTPSLEIYAQANARAHRTGQKNPVTIVRLQGSAAERHIYKLLDSRDNDHTKLVDLYSNILA
jgi:SNF2 family DNA or RNA helicase